LIFAKSNSDFEPSYVLSSANFFSRPDFFRESGAGVAKPGSREERNTTVVDMFGHYLLSQVAKKVKKQKSKKGHPKLFSESDRT
jgi:hypothetical protein